MKRRKFVKYIVAASVTTKLSSCKSAKIQKSRHNTDICKAAWKKLAIDGAAFKYVDPIEGLPNILLYGDSISIGYTPTVQKELKAKANVFRIHKNGMSSKLFISRMETFHAAMFQPALKQGWNFKWDVIHFNVGLHDLKYIKNGKLDKLNGKQVSSIETYKSNLVKICDYLFAQHPNAKLIFANSTPIPKGDVKGRFAGDSEKYNLAAIEVLADYKSISINDLFSLTKSNSVAWSKKPGDVHFNTLGKQEQGKHVAKFITKYLS